MTVLFLLTRLEDPSRESASGGAISNNRLILTMAEESRVVVVPMLYSLVPNCLTRHPGVTVLQPNVKRRGRLSYALARYHSYLGRVRESLSTHAPDQVWASRAAIPAAHRVTEKWDIPLTIITRAFEDHQQAGVIKTDFRGSVFRQIEGRLSRKSILRGYREAARIIVNSKYMEGVTRTAFGTRASFQVVYPEMDIPRGPPLVRSIRRIGFVNKGLKKGTNLVKRLAIRMPGTQFHVFGRDIRDVEGFANVHNHGYVNDRKRLFGSVDLFLVPSLWNEPYGRVAAEAIWRGIPVLVSKRGGLPEAAPSSFFWVDSDAVEDWIDGIARVVEDRSRTRREVQECQAVLASRQNGVEDGGALL